jgi:hypothetical protein
LSLLYSRKEYDDALLLHQSMTPIKSGRMVVATIDRAGRYERGALARIAYAAILTAEVCFFPSVRLLADVPGQDESNPPTPRSKL